METIGGQTMQTKNSYCLTDNTVYYRFRSGLVGFCRVLKIYILLGWVNNIVGWVGLGPVNWTHVYLCRVHVCPK